MVILFIIAILAVFVGIVLFLLGIIEDPKISFVGATIGLIGFLVAFLIVNTDPQRALDRLPVDRYGVVTEIEHNRIEVDDDASFIVKQVVSAKYNTSIEGIKIGDLVKVSYVEGTVNNYITKANTITIVEDGDK